MAESGMSFVSAMAEAGFSEDFLMIALADGRDHRTVLREYDADPADLAAVADELGGKGAGAALRTILRVQAEN